MAPELCLNELPAASPEVQRAYATWRNPPEFEFYDLDNDPYEFNDLSEDPDFEAERERLKNALLDWQKESLDPLNEPNILARVVTEMDSVNTLYPGRDYGKDPDFRWNYPEYFKEFIDSNQERF